MSGFDLHHRTIFCLFASISLSHHCVMRLRFGSCRAVPSRFWSPGSTWGECEPPPILPPPMISNWWKTATGLHLFSRLCLASQARTHTQLLKGAPLWPPGTGGWEQTATFQRRAARGSKGQRYLRNASKSQRLDLWICRWKFLALEMQDVSQVEPEPIDWGAAFCAWTCRGIGWEGRTVLLLSGRWNTIVRYSAVSQFQRVKGF